MSSSGVVEVGQVPCHWVGSRQITCLLLVKCVTWSVEAEIAGSIWEFYAILRCAVCWNCRSLLNHNVFSRLTGFASCQIQSSCAVIPGIGSLIVLAARLHLKATVTTSLNYRGDCAWYIYRCRLRLLTLDCRLITLVFRRTRTLRNLVPVEECRHVCTNAETLTWLISLHGLTELRIHAGIRLRNKDQRWCREWKSHHCISLEPDITVWPWCCWTNRSLSVVSVRKRLIIVKDRLNIQEVLTSLSLIECSSPDHRAAPLLHEVTWISGLAF